MIKSGNNILKKGNTIPTNTEMVRSCVFIIFTGESNPVGYAENSEASAPELAEISSVKIWGYTTNNAFNNLKCGSPDNTNEAGSSSLHGWELELGVQAEAGNFNGKQVYISKNGVGGANAYQWITGSAYWNANRLRILTAYKYLRSQSNQDIETYIFFSLGINDAYDETNLVEFEADFREFVTNLHLLLPTAIILMTKIMTTSESQWFSDINDIIIEVGTELDYVRLVETDDLTRSGYHWDYAGMKTLTDRFLEYVI